MEPTEKKLDLELVGYLNYNDEDENKLKIPSAFKSFKSIDISPFSFCVVENNKLIVADDVSKAIKVYDNEFKIITTVQKVNRKTLQPYAVATNDKDRVYITDEINEKHLI